LGHLILSTSRSCGSSRSTPRTTPRVTAYCAANIAVTLWNAWMLLMSRQPSGEVQLLPVRPLPPVCSSATQHVSGGAASRESLKRDCVEWHERKCRRVPPLPAQRVTRAVAGANSRRTAYTACTVHHVRRRQLVWNDAAAVAEGGCGRQANSWECETVQEELGVLKRRKVRRRGWEREE
jgi:hypothetical protein